MWRMIIAVATLALSAAPASAYIGPGVGAGMIATVLGILAAICLSLFAVFWYPLKRLLKRNSKGRGREDQ